MPVIDFIRNPAILHDIPLGWKRVIFTVNHTGVNLLPFAAEYKLNILFFKGDSRVSAVKVT